MQSIAPPYGGMLSESLLGTVKPFKVWWNSSVEHLLHTQRNCLYIFAVTDSRRPFLWEVKKPELQDIEIEKFLLKSATSTFCQMQVFISKSIFLRIDILKWARVPARWKFIKTLAGLMADPRAGSTLGRIDHTTSLSDSDGNNPGSFRRRTFEDRVECPVQNASKNLAHLKNILNSKPRKGHTHTQSFRFSPHNLYNSLFQWI